MTTMRCLIGSSVLMISVNLVTVAAITPGDVCYGYLGCFSMGSPWFSMLRPIPPPQSPVEIDTQFYLYTRNQPARYHVTKLPNISFSGSDYVGSKPTFILVQGFVSNSNQQWILAMKDALLKEFDGNVVIVDWSLGSTQINYLQVAANARVVGAELIRFTKFLLSDMGAAVSRFHFVGHSIGGHISGYVGKTIPGIAKITGLEVAQPGFEGYPPLVRLDINDAVFVEVIHTNARPFIPTLGFGYMAPLGHVDYYVNGGFDQPGCIIPQMPNLTINSLDDLGSVSFDFLRKTVFCHHARAFLLFTASVANKGCTFWGHKPNPISMALSVLSQGYMTQILNLGQCTSGTCSPLGLQASIYPARGVFLVKSTGSDPYCIPDQHNDGVMSSFKTAPTAPL